MVGLVDVEAFKKIFFRGAPPSSCPASEEKGDMFLCAGKDTVSEVLDRVAKANGLLEPATWESALTPGSHQRLR
eukprot:10045332-Alexandrium_andersonii.AAC.1